MDYLKLTVDKLSVEAVSDLVMDDTCGAVSIFVGTTRDNFEGKKVVNLEYEAYEPMALKALKSICDEIRSKWPAVHGIAIYHRLGAVACREASLVVAVSSPQRRDAQAASARCLERVKASVPVWKREHYAAGHAPLWKENPECPSHSSPLRSPSPPPTPEISADDNLIQIKVSNEELEQRIQNFIERKREQINVSNIIDFIPCEGAGRGGGGGAEEADTCARVRTQFVKRCDSKGHLKIRKVHNEWGPQTVRAGGGGGAGVGGFGGGEAPGEWDGAGERAARAVPAGVAERLWQAERYVCAEPGAAGAGAPVARDIYRRLKLLEDRIAELQSLSPEYAQFWKYNRGPSEPKRENQEYVFSAEDIARKIEMLERRSAARP